MPVHPGRHRRRSLPGQTKVAAPLQIGGSAQSICNWTVDQPPVYRLLQLDLLAYPPNGLASGDGSATNAAIDAYHSDEQALRNPPRNSADPPATVTTLSGLGNAAFSAMQVFRRGGAVTDVATVLVRYRNVTVTVTLNGLDHSNRGSYGPVSARRPVRLRPAQALPRPPRPRCTRPEPLGWSACWYWVSIRRRRR